MRMRAWLLATIGVASLCAAACGDDGDAGERCEPLIDALAQPGDPIDGDDYETFARDFFETYCVRCHSSDNVSNESRNGAPDGFDWDDVTVVRQHLDEIRDAVGVTQFMPFDAPLPSCDERARLVRWIDAAAP